MDPDLVSGQVDSSLPICLAADFSSVRSSKGITRQLIYIILATVKLLLFNVLSMPSTNTVQIQRTAVTF